MSYWTFSDLFEEPGPPTASFQGGFGLVNPEGVRKPAYFAYKYLHSLQGDSLVTTDPQAMLATKDRSFAGVVWDFEQPQQKASNRSFYIKTIPSHSVAPVQLKITHLIPNRRTACKYVARDFAPTMPIRPTWRWGLPRNLPLCRSST